ncbi:helix-turn-helix domain-containing protein [Parabacteroides distasonis]|nr:helix-turn-helix domain-containing protein [Parabacteroides distasonis]
MSSTSICGISFTIIPLALTDLSSLGFIRIIRLQKAAELLKEGKSVTDVAAETGFVNTKYFSSLFKKQFGMQPSKYSGK